jgi:hypothetical protein
MGQHATIPDEDEKLKTYDPPRTEIYFARESKDMINCIVSETLA